MSLLPRLRRRRTDMQPRDRAHQAYLQYLGAPDDDVALLDLATTPYGDDGDPTDDDHELYDSDRFDNDGDHDDD